MTSRPPTGSVARPLTDPPARGSWRRRAALPILLAAFLGEAGPAASQDSPLEGPGAVVDARQAQMAAMQSLGIHIDEEAVGAAGEDLAHLTDEARAIAAFLRGVPSLFPPGTAADDFPGTTIHAAPTIWTERDRFDALAAEALAAAESAAMAGDAAELLARWETLELACAACHTEFLAYDPFAGMAGTAPPDEALFDFGGD